MHKHLMAAFIAIAAFGSVSQAHACGPDTVALLRNVQKMEKPPLFRCGTDFNDVMARVHVKDWKSALAAYESHLTHLGKWEAGSEDAKATLEYLRRMVTAS